MSNDNDKYGVALFKDLAQKDIHVLGNSLIKSIIAGSTSPVLHVYTVSVHRDLRPPSLFYSIYSLM